MTTKVRRQHSASRRRIIQMESEYRAWALDLGRCPWYERCIGHPGFDPEGICDRGCYDEPACQTCIPPGGWPSHPERRVMT